MPPFSERLDQLRQQASDVSDEEDQDDSLEGLKTGRDPFADESAPDTGGEPERQSKLDRRREAAEQGGLDTDPEAGITYGPTTDDQPDRPEKDPSAGYNPLDPNDIQTAVEESAPDTGDETDPRRQSKLERRRNAAESGDLDVDPEAGITYGPTATETDASNDGQPDQGGDEMGALLVGVAVALAIVVAAREV